MRCFLTASHKSVVHRGFPDREEYVVSVLTDTHSLFNRDLDLDRKKLIVIPEASHFSLDIVAVAAKY